MINEGEARDLTGKWNGVDAIEELAAMGPKAVVIKRGEYGFMLFFLRAIFYASGISSKKVVDPTGAGDTFAGGFFGIYLKAHNPCPWHN